MFVINGKEYNALPFDFNLMCDLEDKGFVMQDLDSKNMKALRAYFSICAGLDVNVAGKEIEQHVINGDTLQELAKQMGKEMEKSDFFQALIKGAKAQNAEEQTETREDTKKNGKA